MTTANITTRRSENWSGGDRRAGSESERWESQAPASEHDEQLASFLGWFSVGLGVTQLFAPRSFARMIGVRDDGGNAAITRLVGLRELTCGIGILTRPRPAGWVWARVAGDAMDLALLGNAIASGAPRRDKVAAATAAVLGVTALDTYDAYQLSQRDGEAGRRRGRRGLMDVREAITINRPAEELYRFWHDFQNLPRFMSHLESVQVTGPGSSHWKAKAPAGMTVEWDAEVIDDRPNEWIAWRSRGGQVEHSGSVRFVTAPGGRGTEIHVEMRYNPPGGGVGAAIAKLMGEEPEQQVRDDLRHLKQVMETGEIVLSEASFDGSHILQRPAQPPSQVPARLMRR